MITLPQLLPEGFVNRSAHGFFPLAAFGLSPWHGRRSSHALNYLKCIRSLFNSPRTFSLHIFNPPQSAKRFPVLAGGGFSHLLWGGPPGVRLPPHPQGAALDVDELMELIVESRMGCCLGVGYRRAVLLLFSSQSF